MTVSLESFTGQCQCGAIRYRVTGTSATLFACHCTECQKQSSSAFGMALWIRHPVVTLLAGSCNTWIRRLPSGKAMECSFCPTCGSRLFHQVLGQSLYMSVKPGTLDNANHLPLSGHIWTSSKQRWVALTDSALQYPQNPPDFEALMLAWTEAYHVAT